MDPFAVIILGGLAGLLLALVLLGLYYPGSGNDQLRWKPTRSPELEVQNEIDDLDQMLEGVNARRRARGAQELTEESVRRQVGADRAELAKTRDEHLADLEIAQMLAVKNERRRRKGLPELTLDEFKASREL